MDELTPDQLAVLSAIRRLGKASPKKIASESGVNYNSVRTIVRRLEDSGHLTSDKGKYTVATELSSASPNVKGYTPRDCMVVFTDANTGRVVWGLPAPAGLVVFSPVEFRFSPRSNIGNLEEPKESVGRDN